MPVPITLLSESQDDDNNPMTPAKNNVGGFGIGAYAGGCFSLMTELVPRICGGVAGDVGMTMEVAGSRVSGATRDYGLRWFVSIGAGRH